MDVCKELWSSLWGTVLTEVAVFSAGRWWLAKSSFLLLVTSEDFMRHHMFDTWLKCFWSLVAFGQLSDSVISVRCLARNGLVHLQGGIDVIVCSCSSPVCVFVLLIVCLYSSTCLHPSPALFRATTYSRGRRITYGFCVMCIFITNNLHYWEYCHSECMKLLDIQ